MRNLRDDESLLAYFAVYGPDEPSVTDLVFAAGYYTGRDWQDRLEACVKRAELLGYPIAV